MKHNEHDFLDRPSSNVSWFRGHLFAIFQSRSLYQPLTLPHVTGFWPIRDLKPSKVFVNVYYLVCWDNNVSTMVLAWYPLQHPRWWTSHSCIQLSLHWILIIKQKIHHGVTLVIHFILFSFENLLKPLCTFDKHIVQAPHFVYHNLYIK